jgi:hypothetical protein
VEKGGFMRKKSVMVIAALLAATAAMLSTANSQSAIREVPPTMSDPVPFLDVLGKEAEKADTPRGAEAYSKHLIKVLVGNEMGDDFVSTQAARLAAADLSARRGDRGLVDERTVADTFNELMKRVRGRGRTIVTDTATVHRLRLGISHASPALTTVSAHASTCLPSEALLLIALLITNNGAIGEPSSPRSAPELRGTTGRRVSAANADASLLLVNFLSSHSNSEDVELFDVLAKYVGF